MRRVGVGVVLAIAAGLVVAGLWPFDVQLGALALGIGAVRKRTAGMPRTDEG